MVGGSLGTVGLCDPTGNVNWQVEESFQAGRTTERPTDFAPIGGSAGTNGGHYRTVLRTGLTTGLTANQPIVSIRWTQSNLFFVLLRWITRMNLNTAFGTAQLIDFQLFIARGFTAVDSGGTTSIPGAGMQKVRDSGGNAMSNSLVGDMRVAATGTLTAGTRTLDTQPIGDAMFTTTNVLGNCDTQEVYAAIARGQHPVVLGNNEGLIGQVPTAQGSTGKVVYTHIIDWCETLQY